MQFKNLSKSNQTLITLCRDIFFGYLTDLKVVDGEIHTTPQTRKCTTVKLDRASADSRPGATGDFTLSPSQELLMNEIANRRNVRIVSIDIRDGRPANVSFEEAVAAF